jgi:hypothetical protein
LTHNEEKPDESKKVLNSLMKSNSEVIKNCAQSIKGLNEQIEQNEFLHKTTLFKRIDRQLFKLMVNLDQWFSNFYTLRTIFVLRNKLRPSNIQNKFNEKSLFWFTNWIFVYICIKWKLEKF